MATYQIQYGNAAPETVGQDVIDALTKNRTLSAYTVTKLDAPAKPVESKTETAKALPDKSTDKKDKAGE